MLSRFAGWSHRRISTLPELRCVVLPGERSRGEFLYSLWSNGNKSMPFDMVTDTANVVIDAGIFADGFESGDTSNWDATVGN